jgi:hypothetical protein
MNSGCPEFRSVVSELDRVAPGVPLLALGQTVFWDEPMKSGVFRAFRELGGSRRFVAGIHDTDYFAKFPVKGSTGVTALPHNDTTTKDLWSAAGEFSHLFGSETVVTKDKLTGSGAKVGLIEQFRPGFLDHVTEAYGWRGVVSQSTESKITAEKRLSVVFPALFDTLSWSLEESLALISGGHHRDSVQMAARIRQIVCEVKDSLLNDCLASFYEALLTPLHQLVSGGGYELETTRTTRLLRFNSETADLERFAVLDWFLNPAHRDLARRAYDESLEGSEIYSLARFGSGALPFDLYVPGVGRGTLRLGNRGGVVMTENPVGFSFKGPITTRQQLAAVLEQKFGPDCVLVGKAVMLPLMLSAEYVFVFHEGASGYLWRTGKLARLLADAGCEITWHPILRVKLKPWEAMDDCCAWLHLPEPMHRAFGTEELSAPTFALRWQDVALEQKTMLRELSEVRRPLALLGYLQSQLGGQWERLAQEYESLQLAFSELGAEIADVKYRKRGVLLKLRGLKARRNELEHDRGRQWRAEIFEHSLDQAALERRQKFGEELRQVDGEIDAAKREFSTLEREQQALVSTPRVVKHRDRRFNIALEAELMRMRLVREAVVSGEGLMKAGYRPAAWWFPLVCPDGTWFRSTMMKSECRIEPLVVRSEVGAS